MTHHCTIGKRVANTKALALNKARSGSGGAKSADFGSSSATLPSINFQYTPSKCRSISSRLKDRVRNIDEQFYRTAAVPVPSYGLLLDVFFATAANDLMQRVDVAQPVANDFCRTLKIGCDLFRRRRVGCAPDESTI